MAEARVKRYNEPVLLHMPGRHSTPPACPFPVQVQHAAVSAGAGTRLSTNGFAANAVLRLQDVAAQAAATKAAGRSEGVSADAGIF